MRLVIPGEPVAQGRPRATRQGRVYDPETSRNYKAYVRLLASQKKGVARLSGPLSVKITAVFSIPKSKPKKFKAAALELKELPTKRPDVDNLAKIVCDSVNGILWDDDCQIVELSVRKIYGEAPRVEMEVEKVEVV